MVQIVFDASDFARIGAIYQRMPADLQKIAFRRAAGRSRGAVERDYARFASRMLKIAQKLVKARMRSHLDGSDIVLDVKSAWIPLNEMNPRQGARGVIVPGRKQYRHAFIASPSSRRAAGLVLLRKGKARTPTEMLFGPNPANAINRKPADYEDILAEIAANEFAKTILQQAEYLMGKAG